MKSMIQLLSFAALTAGLALLTSCATMGGDTSKTTTSQGVVLQVRAAMTTVNKQNPPTLGKPGVNVANRLGTVGGVVVGGTVGSDLNEESTLQYIVKLNDSGRIVLVTQSVEDSLRPGSHVLVIFNGAHAIRVVVDKHYLSAAAQIAK